MLEARDLARRALADAPDDPGHLVTVHRRLALAHLLLAELGTAERHARAATRLAERGGDRAGLARALANHACIAVLRGHHAEAAPLLQRALALEDAPGIASIDDSPSAVAGLLLMYAGEIDAARRRLLESVERAEQHGGDPLSTGLLFALSELESRAARYGEAAEYARRGLGASEQTGQATERAVLLFAGALADAHLGRESEARVAASEGLAIAEEAAHRFAQAQNRWALGVLEAGLGRPLEAWTALEPAVRILRDGGVGELGVVPVHVEAIEALTLLGRTGEARELLGELERAATTRWLVAAARRCRGPLLAAAGQLAPGIAELEQAVAEARELARPFDQARALLALGAVQRRAKRRADARDSLAAARALFQELGAAGWAERAEGELGRLSGRRARDRDELTPMELRVAELAARGRSNREIAAELFVAERTVEANLTRVYRKLGVRSRTELVRRLPAG